MKTKTAWNKGICHLSENAKKRIGICSKERIKEKGHPRGMLGKHHTKETIARLKKWRPTDEQKKKMMHCGQDSSLWIGKDVIVKCKVCGKQIKCRPNKLKKYCGYKCLGISKRKEQYKCKFCGRKVSRKEIDRCRYCFIKQNKGSNNHLWKGGISTENNVFRASSDYRKWREKVFKRDNWTCQKCGQRGGILNAHHIKRFSKYKKQRLVIKNGITLCEKCHKQLHRRD